MAASRSKDFKNAIVALLEGIQLDGEPAFAQVKGHPRGQFDSWPAARVLPGDITTERGAYGQNDRAVVLTARIHVPVTNEGTEFDKMYELTDAVLDAIDAQDYIGTLITTLSAEELAASRGEWFDEDSPTGPILSCDLTVTMTYSHDN